MSEIGKYPLDDDELDKVSGGVQEYQGLDCNDCDPIDKTKINSCSNCTKSGNCMKKQLSSLGF